VPTGRSSSLWRDAVFVIGPLFAGALGAAGERRIEAESGVLAGGACAVKCQASGGAAVANMHHGASSCTLQGVDGGPGGPAEIAVVYATKDGTARLRVRIGDKDAGELLCPSTGGWDVFTGRVSLTADLLPGTSNKIQFLGGRGGVNIDYVEVAPRSATTPSGRRTQRDVFFLVPGDVIVLIGDAVTADGRYMARALAEIRTRYPELSGPEGVRVVNAGFPGATAALVAGRLDGLLEVPKVTVAVVCLGLNDVLAGLADACVSQVQGIVRRLSGRGVAVTLLAPPALDPTGRPELAPSAERLAQLVEELGRLAGQEGVLFADCHSVMRRDIETGSGDYTWGDGIHPEERGHTAMAEALMRSWKLGRPVAHRAE